MGRARHCQKAGDERLLLYVKRRRHNHRYLQQLRTCGLDQHGSGKPWNVRGFFRDTMTGARLTVTLAKVSQVRPTGRSPPYLIDAGATSGGRPCTSEPIAPSLVFLHLPSPLQVSPSLKARLQPKLPSSQTAA